MKAMDLTGCRFDRLTVLKFDGYIRYPGGATQKMWLCRCDCGSIIPVRQDYLCYGHTRSCGCIRKTTQKKTVRGKSVTVSAPKKRGSEPVYEILFTDFFYQLTGERLE